MNKRSVFLLFVLVFTLASISNSFGQAADSVYFATDPAVSPNGKTIVFCYESDLWKVPAKGGQAVRLTGMDGNEADPAISPDGKWLAFSSNQYGQNDVYVMPMAGGDITRLTYHQANDQVESWSWHADSLYFRSNRYNQTSEYAVSPHGGTPRRMFGNYFNTVNDLVEAPNKPVFYFNESWQSFLFPQRKRYRGPFNADIKSYNTRTKSFQKLTSWDGKDFRPMLDRTGNLYFVSDQGNKQFNLYTFKDGKKTPLTHFNTSVRNPSISADGKLIAFEKEYQLYTYHTKSGRRSRIPISVGKNNTLGENKSFNTKDHISDVAVSPDGKKLAFVSRGELFASDAKGKFIHKITTDEMGRVQQVEWEKDNKTLLFNQTVDGFQNWFTITADSTRPAKQLTHDHRNNRMLTLNPARTEGVYLSGRDELRLLNLSSGKSKTIVKDHFWGYENDPPRFSPDAKWVVYTARRNFERDIFVHNIKGDSTINLTNTGVSEGNPFWGPEGNYIYFSSSRTHPSYPRGGGNTSIYRMALHPMQEPFKSTRYDKLFKQENKEKKEKHTSEEKADSISINIQKEGLMQRLEQIGPSFGSQYAPYVIKKKHKTIVLYNSNRSEGKVKLWKTTLQPFEDPKTSGFKGVRAATNLSLANDDLYGLHHGSVYKLDVKHGKAKKITLAQNFERDLKTEFAQMFQEMWANIKENYYTGTFNQTNWQAIKKRYATYLPHISTRAEFRRMMNDMLGELNSSHVGFRTYGPKEKTFYETRTLAVGLIFKNNAPYTVQHVVENSLASLSSHPIRAGDQLVAVNGTRVDPRENRNQYFSSSKMKDEMELTFKHGGKPYTVRLHPASYRQIRSKLYDEWEDRNQKQVDKETNKRVAYIHLKAMGNNDLHKFLTQMTSETYNRDALILDLRYNTGGNVHNAVLHFLEQRPYIKWKYRDAPFAPQPNFAPEAKPIVLLVNHQTLSDGEVTAAGFKQLKLGTIIGSHTYQWIIFTSGKSLVDGSYYRLPSWGVYTLDGKNLEHTGVQPDISVHNTFKDRLEGKDPQLQQAIQYIKEKLDQRK